MSLLRSIVPRWVPLEEQGGRQVPEVATGASDLVDRAVQWWKDDAYTRVPRPQGLRWLGITWSKRTYYRTVRDTYGAPAADTVALIEDMQRAGAVPPLTAASKIFEGGCNVGRNLYYLQDRFGCEVSGLDISQGAIPERDAIWRGRSRYHFVVDNALTTSYFDSIPDRAFDLVFTRWHLIHVPRSDAKRRYVASLKRIAKALVLVEPVRDGVTDVQLCHDGTYTLSWDDWTAEYGVVEYPMKPGLSMGPETRVFFWKNWVDQPGTAT